MEIETFIFEINEFGEIIYLLETGKWEQREFNIFGRYTSQLVYTTFIILVITNIP